MLPRPAQTASHAVHSLPADSEDVYKRQAVQSTQLTSCDETYSLPQGKKSQYRNHYNQREIVLEKDGRICKIYFRMYDDGIAFRYELLGEGAVLIQSETSQFNLPDSTGGWAFDWRNDYEGLYTYRSPSEFSSANFAMPVLASIDNNRYWMLLTEGNVYNSNGSYCACLLYTSRIRFHCLQCKRSTLPAGLQTG